MSRPGFTLLETLVAIAVTGLVLLSSYGLFSTATQLRTRTAVSVRETSEAAYLRALIIKLVSGALREQEGMTGVDATFGSYDRDVLGFRSESHQNVLISPGRFRIRVDGTSPPSLVVESIRGDGTVHVAAVPGISSLDISFLAAGSTAWTRGWPAETTAPAAVELQFGGSQLHPLLRVPLLVRSTRVR